MSAKALIAAILIAWTLLLGTAPAADPATRANCTHPALTHIRGADRRAERGWDADDVVKRPAAIRRVRENARCVPPSLRHVVEKAIRRARADYKAALTFRREVTPFYFGEGGDLEYVAIPAYIIECETEGFNGADRWNATNGSHEGPYQLSYATFANVTRQGIGDGTWSHENQHVVARHLWVTYGPSQWSCA